MAEGVEIPIDIRASGAQNATRSVDDILEVLRKISSSVDGISGKMDSLGNHTKDAMQKGEHSAESFIDKLGKVGLAIQGVMGIAQSIAGVIGPIFAEGLSRENSEMVFGKLLGTPEQGKKYAEELRTSALAALYGGGNVNSAAQQMIAFGIDEGDTRQVLDAIGNIAMGDANKLNSLSLAFAQMSSLGKLQAQDWKQMIGQGFNPLNEIAKKTGESMEQLNERMSKGTITADEVKEAFISAASGGGQFAGIMDERMKGLDGAINSVKASVEDLYAELFNALKPLAEAILPKVTKAFQFITEVLKGQHPVISSLATVVGALGVGMAAYAAYTKLAGVWTTVLTVKQMLLNIALNANPIGLVVAGIAALIALVTTIIVKYDEWGAAISFLAGPFGMVINLIQSFRRHWDSIVDAFKSGGIIVGIKRIGLAILDSILYPLQQMFEVIGLDSFAGKIKAFRGNHSLLSPQSEGITPGAEGPSTMGGKANKSASVTSKPSASAAGNKAVATGGTRNTSITINLGSLVHQISYNQKLEKNTSDTTADLQEALLRVLNAAASTGGI